MGSVFKAHVTRPLPAGAEIIEREGKRFAVWKDRKGKQQQAEATEGDNPRIRKQAGTYSAKYRDGNGIVRVVATGCGGRDAARAVLADLERQAEKVRAGIFTTEEAHVAEHAESPIVDHVDAYVAALSRQRGKGARTNVSPEHVANVQRTLHQIVVECGFKRLPDFSREAVERWVSRLLGLPDRSAVGATAAGTSPARPAPRTVNAKLAALTAWGNWLVEAGRLTSNPFARLRKLEEADDIRRKRRALTADELERLLTATRLRPLAEFGRETIRLADEDRPPQSRATWRQAELTFNMIADAAERGRSRLRPEVAAEKDRLGQERALIYRVLFTTGLRRGELAALTMGDVVFNNASPAIQLRGVHAKNGKSATLPLRADVAAELRQWIEQKTEALCRHKGDVAGAAHVAVDEPLFRVPEQLVKVLNRDLAAAGIPKVDERGRTVDVHAMRGTFASHLAAAGVPPVTLRTLMRHARIETTLKHYTDSALLDLGGAVEMLPVVSAGTTGTDGVAPDVALAPGQSRQNQSVSGIQRSGGGAAKKTVTSAKKQKPPQNRSSARVPVGG